jgi:hypothetical protein
LVPPGSGGFLDDHEAHWIVAADGLFLHRSAARTQPLLFDPGANAVLLDASNLDFSMSAGERITLSREEPNGLGLELSYCGIDSWRSSASIPNSAFLYGLGYLSIDEAMTVSVSDAQFEYRSRLYSAECNVRYTFRERFTPLVGVRWIDFEDQFTSNGQALAGAYTQLARGHNHLYGAQIGLDARLFDRTSAFQVSLLSKAGIYCNAAAANNEYSDSLYDFAASDSGSQLSFLGEVGLTASLRFTKCLTARCGYQVMWLTGVALAPEQIEATDFGTAHLGINTSGSLFCHGATAGLELMW